jgi:hypothetical protein
MLLDEPGGPRPSIQLQPLRRSRAAKGKTLLVATHDLSCVTRCLTKPAEPAHGLRRPHSVFTEELLNEAFKSHPILPMQLSYYGASRHEDIRWFTDPFHALSSGR